MVCRHINWIRSSMAAYAGHDAGDCDWLLPPTIRQHTRLPVGDELIGDMSVHWKSIQRCVIDERYDILRSRPHLENDEQIHLLLSNQFKYYFNLFFQIWINHSNTSHRHFVTSLSSYLDLCRPSCLWVLWLIRLDSINQTPSTTSSTLTQYTSSVSWFHLFGWSLPSALDIPWL